MVFRNVTQQHCAQKFDIGAIVTTLIRARCVLESVELLME